MKKLYRWLLPEGVDETLPPHARRLEELSRRLLDLFASWGYELVMPPLVEYLDSLLTGSGADLESRTFKFSDPHDGRLLGVRADITPQVARIDAHRLQRQGPARLCYLGAALHAMPSGYGFGSFPGGSRNRLQAGAELYGHAGMGSDLEVMALACEALEAVNLTDSHLELGHPGIFRTLAHEAGLGREQALDLFRLLQRKATHEARALLKSCLPGKPEQVTMLSSLCELHGGMEILGEAQRLLAPAGSRTRRCLDELSDLAAAVEQQVLPKARLHLDLGELRGFRYHTGVVFTAYLPGHRRGLVFGGRYDDVGAAFGRARPATGFSMDVKQLADMAPGAASRPDLGILAPWPGDDALRAMVKQLRAEGERVVHLLSGQDPHVREACCDRVLRRAGETWQVESLSAHDSTLK